MVGLRQTLSGAALVLAVSCSRAAAQDQASPSSAPSKTNAPLAVVARLNKGLSARKLKAGDKVTGVDAKC